MYYIPKYIRIIITTIIYFVVIATTAYAQNVRGRLDGRGPYGAYPVPRIAVTLSNPAYGRSAPVFSDYQGIYYFFNIPPGPHTLEVWVNPNQPIIFNIFVNPNQMVTDIAPILVR
jgi:hypothetical protein